MGAYRIVVAGASMGGRNAISVLLRSLPPDFPLPIAIVMHRTRHGDQLERTLGVLSVEDKDELRPGRAYLAPPDYHLLVQEDGFALSTEDKVRNSRPSIDVLFESAAEAFGPAVIAVVLTGANEDGARGARRIKQCGGAVICQDPRTAESPIMPAAAIEAAQPEHVLALEEIGPMLACYCRGGR